MAPGRLARAAPLSETIEIRGMRVFGRHGANPGERERPQPFDVDLVLGVDVKRARRTDALEDTVDYAAIAARVRSIVEGTSFALLERLGQEILDALFEDRRIESAEIALAKPGLLSGATPVVRLRARNR
ncbi:MAG TPA: dihydroneopterin aldolase [Candidatus Acidoferrales bacterium]|nr:dihydroneopterin aldolase [Candidatus Acidoferrales bacterium]